jgi:hypothetical protein
LAAAIEQRLSTDFSITPTSPELTFRVRAFFEVPKSEVIARNENVRMQTGTRPAVDAAGNPVMVNGQQAIEPVYENRELPVEVWQGSGRLSLQVEVIGADGRPLDGFSPSQAFSRRVNVAVNGVAQVDRNQLPNEMQITEALIGAVADPFVERYCRQREAVEVRLAVDEELRQGNELAKAGQWPKAAELWTATEPKKFPGDRLHNLGVAFESTFYELYWRGEPLAKLQAVLKEARRLHDDAIVQDPKEKAHAAAQERLGRAAALLARLTSAATASAATASAPAMSSNVPTSTVFPQGHAQGHATGAVAPPAANPAVNPAVQDFRRLIRVRIRNLAAVIDTDRPSLEQTGVAAFQLSAEEAKQIVEAEIQPWLKIRDNLLLYKATFDSFLTDQKVTREERQVLRGLATRLMLSSDDLKLVESVAQFTEVP